MSRVCMRVPFSLPFASAANLMNGSCRLSTFVSPVALSVCCSVVAADILVDQSDSLQKKKRQRRRRFRDTPYHTTRIHIAHASHTRIHVRTAPVLLHVSDSSLSVPLSPSLSSAAAVLF